MNLPGREAKVARRISDLSEQIIEEQKNRPSLRVLTSSEKPHEQPRKDAVRVGAEKAVPMGQRTLARELLGVE